MAIKIMIADDHSMIREGLKSLLELEGDIQVVAEAEDGSVLGYLITARSTEGYNGLVQISVGITSEGNLTGLGFLSISETPGLGMKAKEPSFYEQYVGKNPTKFAVSKDGGDGEQIDALSGATITTNSMTNGVNAGLAAFRYEKGGSQK